MVKRRMLTRLWATGLKSKVASGNPAAADASEFMRRNMKLRKFCAAQKTIRIVSKPAARSADSGRRARRTRVRVRGSPDGIARLMLFRNFDAALHASASAFD
jgi:hypothetical protein